MIKLAELKGRKYEGKKCVSFEYDLVVDESNGKQLKVDFEYQDKDSLGQVIWDAKMFIKKTEMLDSQTYHVQYMIPRENLPLELIAAIGLRYLQTIMKDEIQKKMQIDWAISHTVEGM